MTKTVRRTAFVVGACLVAVGTMGAWPVSAQTIVEEWSKVQPPPPPELKPVTVDPHTTALLVFDFVGAQDPTKGPCNSHARPRCIASIPRVKALLDKARAAGMPVIFSLAGVSGVGDIATALAPQASEPVVKSGPDKFVGTDLDKILAAKGIKTVIITGTTAEGVVLATGTDAALRGFNVILPVDGMSAADLYPEQYVAWHMTHAPGVAPKVTLTRTDLITF